MAHAMKSRGSEVKMDKKSDGRCDILILETGHALSLRMIFLEKTAKMQNHLTTLPLPHKQRAEQMVVR